jgi:hypothetical protein
VILQPLRGRDWKNGRGIAGEIAEIIAGRYSRGNSRENSREK